MDTTSRDEAVWEVFNPYELAGYLATLKPVARKKLQKLQQGAPNPLYGRSWQMQQFWAWLRKTVEAVYFTSRKLSDKKQRGCRKSEFIAK